MFVLGTKTEEVLWLESFDATGVSKQAISEENKEEASQADSLKQDNINVKTEKQENKQEATPAGKLSFLNFSFCCLIHL